MQTSADDLLGQTIEGYQLMRVLGRGGMSIVFLGQSVDDARIQVAIKVLQPFRPSLFDDYASFQTRFTREAHTAQQLQHEHIVPVLSYGETDDLTYMIMPFIAGGTLATRLAQQQEPLPLVEIAKYLKQLASALDYAHQNGVVHRDIKPSNVLLDEQGNVYLADFGIAQLYDIAHGGLEAEPTSLTATGEMLGTPTYIAPERFLGEPAGPLSDIYALGIMLYRLVTGNLPFEADNPLALGMKHLNEIPLPPRSLRPELPESAEVAILRAIAKQPADRFASTGLLAQTFVANLEGQPISEQTSVALLAPMLPLEPDQAIAASVEESEPSITATVHRAALLARSASLAVSPTRHLGQVILAALLTIALALLALYIVFNSSGQEATPPSSLYASSGNSGSIGTGGVTPSVTFAKGTATVSGKNNKVTVVQTSTNALIWQHEVNGQIVQPPVVVNGVIYVVTTKGMVYAFQGSNGYLIWTYDTRNPVGTPLLVSNGVVYIHTLNGYVYELRASDGHLIAILKPTPGATPTPSPFPTPTPTPGATPTPDPSPSPTATPTPDPTSTPAPSPTPTGTP